MGGGGDRESLRKLRISRNPSSFGVQATRKITTSIQEVEAECVSTGPNEESCGGMRIYRDSRDKNLSSRYCDCPGKVYENTVPFILDFLNSLNRRLIVGSNSRETNVSRDTRWKGDTRWKRGTQRSAKEQFYRLGNFYNSPLIYVRLHSLPNKKS